MQGLEGVRVLELGNMVSAAYATKLQLVIDLLLKLLPALFGQRDRRPTPSHGLEERFDLLGHTDEEIAQFKATEVLY